MTMVPLLLWLSFSSVVSCLSPDAQPRHSSLSALLILGMGRVGSLVAQQAAPHFDIVYGTKRKRIIISSNNNNNNNNKNAGSDKDNIREIDILAEDQLESALATCSCTHILITTPAMSQPHNGDNDKDDHDKATIACNKDETVLPYADILRKYLVSSRARPGWIGVLSTTGVYGDHQGAWVTETSPCHCPEECSAAAAYLQWERRWAEWSRDTNAVCRIFRCAGIYGASRSSLHTLYQKGDDKSCSSSSSTAQKAPITNRIHERDLVAAVLASMLLGKKDSSPSTTTSTTSSGATVNDFEIYNLSDNLPESREIVFDYAKQLFSSRGIEIPPRSSHGATAARASKRSIRRGQETKRVCNQKMKDQLVDLSFPTYKEGLADILENPDAPWFSSMTEQEV